MTAQKNDYWFRPKRYGYGATPINWKGWLFVLLFVLWAFVITAYFVLIPALNGETYNQTNFVSWAVLLVVSVLALVFISRAKTEGEWRWRWGDES